MILPLPVERSSSQEKVSYPICLRLTSSLSHTRLFCFVSLKDCSILMRWTVFFLEVTYPHLRVVLVRAVIKDPEWVLHLTLMPQVCLFRTQVLECFMYLLVGRLFDVNHSKTAKQFSFHFQVERYDRVLQCSLYQ